MKALILTSNQPNQAALATKMAAALDVAAIVLSDNVPRKPKPRAERVRIMINRVEGRLAGRPLVRAWGDMQKRYHELYPCFPDVPTIPVRNVNDEATLEAIRTHDPDLVIVSGTNLVGSAVIKASSKKVGIVNLHTGISPYVKGGPNCTNWCLAERYFHLIGSTVMWIDLGIDTGHIITTERAPLTGDESIAELHWAVMEHAHDLYVRAVKAIAANQAVPRIPQDELGEGRTFLMNQWSAGPILRARVNHKIHYSPRVFRSEEFKRQCDEVRTIPLPSA